MIDLERVRADTVGIDDIVHLNNCGSALPPGCVVDAQVDYLRTEQRMGGYEAAEARADDLHEFYVQTARMLGCGSASPRGMHSTSGSTRSPNASAGSPHVCVPSSTGSTGSWCATRVRTAAAS